MGRPKLSQQIRRQIDKAVAAYEARMAEYAKLAEWVSQHLTQHDELSKLVHSSKLREKAPSHLRDKLVRRATQAIEEGKPFTIADHNIFKRVEDLAGVRLLHVHTKQLLDIHPRILDVLSYYKYEHARRPVAYIWDIENEEMFKRLSLRTIERPSMYTSVHYVVRPHFDRKMMCEIQVRTLAEELWGEVSHTVDYPHPTESTACKEQLKALARFTLGCSRLVDSIYASLEEYNSWQP